MTTYGIVSSEWTGLESTESKTKEKAGKKRKAASGVFGLMWHRMVLDEAHTIRNRKTRAAKSVMNLSRLAQIKWGLTGRAAGNSSSDLRR